MHFESLLQSTYTNSRQFHTIRLGWQLVLFTFKSFILQNMTFYFFYIKTRFKDFTIVFFFGLSASNSLHLRPHSVLLFARSGLIRFQLVVILHKHCPRAISIFTPSFCYITNLGGCTMPEKPTAVYIFTGMLGFHREIVHNTLLCVYL